MADDYLVPTNPAARLHRVFSIARALPNDGALAQWQIIQQASYGDGFGPEANRSSFYLFVSSLWRQYDSVRSLLAPMKDENVSLATRHLTQVEDTLENFTAIRPMGMTEFMAPCTELAMYGLELCADILHRRAREPLLSDDTIDELLRRLEELKTQVLSSDLPPEMYQTLYEKLNDVVWTVRSYAINGAVPIAGATDALAGYVARQGRLGNLKSSPLLKTIFGLIMAVDVALNLGANYQALTSSTDDTAVVKVEVHNIYPPFQFQDDSELPEVAPDDDGSSRA